MEVRLPNEEFGSANYENVWPTEDDLCIVKGWGCTASGLFHIPHSICSCSKRNFRFLGGPVQTHAHAVRLPIVASSECIHRSVGPTRICAGNIRRLAALWSLGAGNDRSQEAELAQRGICAGDSGGPLVCLYNDGKWLQAGVASYTSLNNPGFFPGVFTRVSYYYPWIEHTLQEHSKRQQQQEVTTPHDKEK